MAKTIEECVPILKEDPIIVTEYNYKTIKLSTYNHSVGTHVTAICLSDYFKIIGPTNVTCLSTGKWSDVITHKCQRPVVSPPPFWTTNMKLIVGLSSSGCAAILLLAIICLVNSISKRKKAKHDRLTNSNVIPLSERPRQKEAQYRYRGEVAFNNESEITQTRGIRYNPAFVDDSAVQNGGHYQRKSESTVTNKSLSPANKETRRYVYNLISADRTKTRYVAADSLSDLMERGRTKFDIAGDVFVVLEEDGTDIEDDDILVACKDYALMLLHINQEWTHPTYSSNEIKEVKPLMAEAQSLEDDNDEIVVDYVDDESIIKYENNRKNSISSASSDSDTELQSPLTKVGDKEDATDEMEPIANSVVEDASSQDEPGANEGVYLSIKVIEEEF